MFYCMFYFTCDRSLTTGPPANASYERTHSKDRRRGDASIVCVRRQTGECRCSAPCRRSNRTFSHGCGAHAPANIRRRRETQRRTPALLTLRELARLTECDISGVGTKSTLRPGAMRGSKGCAAGAPGFLERRLTAPPYQLGGSREHCKLPQWGLGRSPVRQEFDAFWVLRRVRCPATGVYGYTCIYPKISPSRLFKG